MNEIEQYFEACGYQPDEIIGIGTRAGAEGKIYFSTSTVAEAPRQIAARSNKNVWINACPIRRPTTPGSRGTAEDVTRLPALWADLDVKETGLPTMEAAQAVIGAISELIDCEPQVIVYTGHGMQPRWRLEHGGLLVQRNSAVFEDLAGFGRLVQNVAERFGGKVDNVFDLPRILRAPGTVNLKPGEDPVPVGIKFISGGAVDINVLESAIEAYAPAPVVQPAPELPRATDVDLSRGDAWLDGALRGLQVDLSDAQDWPDGHVDDRGRGWEKLTADVARRLAQIAKAEWNSLTEDEAHTFLMQHAPTSAGWGASDIQRKWDREWAQAEPAEAPVERKVQSDDPLDDNYVPPAVDLGRADGAGPGGSVDSVPAWAPHSWDDLGNAERVVARFGDVLRYSPALERWLRYDNGVWIEDKKGGQWAAQQVFADLIELEAAFYSDEVYQPSPHAQPTSERVEFVKFAKKQRFSARAKAAAEAIMNEHVLDAALPQFDQHPNLLNVVNGVIDTTSGELLEHDPALMLRQQSPVAYDPNAEAPEWEKYLQTVMPEEAVREYLQRIVGYSITGSTGEQALFLHHGPPAAGKSLFLRIIEAVLGPSLSQIVPPTTLLAKKQDQHPTDIAGLEGARFLQMSEIGDGARLDEAVVKRLTGEETITARGMGQDFRKIRIVGKVHIATNHMPHISDDRATHRRIHVVPWTVEIPQELRDITLAERIIAHELPGVLAWAVRGARMWQQDRLARPVQAQIALDEYVESEDELGEWLRERTLSTGEGGAWTPLDQLYRGYAQWCDGNRMPPMSRNTFGKKLAIRGIPGARSKAARGYRIVLMVPDPLDR